MDRGSNSSWGLPRGGRLSPQSGIALGPVIFILAILAILAGAIAVGAGGFTGSTSTPSASTMAATILQESEQVQSATQMLLANGCLESQLNFYAVSAGATISANGNAPPNGSCNVFDPRGGAMQFQPLPPSACNTAMGTCEWGPSDSNLIPGVGTGVSEPIWMAYYLTSAVCNQINSQLGLSGPPATTAISGITYDGTFPQILTLYPAYTGVIAACVANGANVYVFYRVLWTR